MVVLTIWGISDMICGKAIFLHSTEEECSQEVWSRNYTSGVEQGNLPMWPQNVSVIRLHSLATALLITCYRRAYPEVSLFSAHSVYRNQGRHCRRRFLKKLTMVSRMSMMYFRTLKETVIRRFLLLGRVGCRPPCWDGLDRLSFYLTPSDTFYVFVGPRTKKALETPRSPFVMDA